MDANLFCSYNVIFSFLTKFGLIIKYRKTKVFYFSRSQRVFDPPSLNLTSLGGLILCPKNTWYYLGLISDQKLSFQQHIDFYTNKVISTIVICKFHLSGKLHPRGDATSEPYKPAFHGGHLSRNTSHGGAATFRIFRLPWRRYSYSTQSSMTELLLSVSQHWNLRSGQ